MSTRSNSGGHGDVAVEYATRYRWPVFPDGDEPSTATTDGDRVRQSWQRQPHAPVLLATGALSGLIGLVVSGDAAQAELAALEREHGELGPTPTTISPQGRVYLLRLPPGVTVPTMARLPGSALGVCGENGGILLPPGSDHVGEQPGWSAMPNHGPALAPRALLEHIQAASKASGSPAANEPIIALGQAHAVALRPRSTAAVDGPGAPPSAEPMVSSHVGEPAQGGRRQLPAPRPKDDAPATQPTAARPASPRQGAAAAKERQATPRQAMPAGNAAKGSGKVSKLLSKRAQDRFERRHGGIADPFMLC